MERRACNIVLLRNKKKENRKRKEQLLFQSLKEIKGIRSVISFLFHSFSMERKLKPLEHTVRNQIINFLLLKSVYENIILRKKKKCHW